MPTPRTTTRTLTRLTLTAPLALALSAGPAQAQTYQPTELGTLGGADSQAYALNDYGQIVGRSHDVAELTHAFHWQNEDIRDLNVELRWGLRRMHLKYGVAYDVSNTDHVVGATQCAPSETLPPDEVDADVSGGGYVHACIFRPGVMTDQTSPYPGNALTYLGTLPGGARSAATGISRNGWYVVGWSDSDSNGQVLGFIITATNGQWAGGDCFCDAPSNALMKPLDTLAALDESSSATAVNNSGRVVGWSYNAAGGYSAFLIAPLTNDDDSNPWQEDADGDGDNDLMVDLGTLGGDNAWARDISDIGLIVGESDTTDWHTHAFIWDNGVMTDLGTLGGNNSSAAAINNTGQVVGWSLDAAGDKRAFLWDQGNGLRDLNGLLPSGFGIRLTEARDINDNGEITGWGTVGTGDDLQLLGFLLTPLSGSGGTSDPGDGTGDDTNGDTSGEADLNPISSDDSSDDSSGGSQDSTAADTTSGDLPPLGLLHFLCGTGVIPALPFVLAGLCGLKLACRATRHWSR